MTTIVVNAISVKEGGSLVVLHELLPRMVEIRPEWSWVVVVHSEVKEALPKLPTIEYRKFPAVDRQAWRVRLWDEFGLPRLLKELGANLLFSHTNYLPWRGMPCQTLLLVQHAGHFSPIFKRLTEEQLNLIQKIVWRVKGRWVKLSVRRADAVIVQTQALAHRIVSETGCSLSRVRVIAHGCGQALQQSIPTVSPEKSEPWRIGYITKAGVQKNFALLFKAVELLRNKGIELTLVMTLSEGDAGNRTVLASVEQYGIAGFIENHGEVSPEMINQLYRTLHIFVFPSLCESFGFPMVEAMAYGIPLLVADVDSNIEVAGIGGISFPNNDPTVLAQEIERLVSELDWFKLRAQASLLRSADFSWFDAADKILSLMDEIMGDKFNSVLQYQADS